MQPSRRRVLSNRTDDFDAGHGREAAHGFVNRPPAIGFFRYRKIGSYDNDVWFSGPHKSAMKDQHTKPFVNIAGLPRHENAPAGGRPEQVGLRLAPATQFRLGERISEID